MSRGPAAPHDPGRWSPPPPGTFVLALPASGNSAAFGPVELGSYGIPTRVEIRVAGLIDRRFSPNPPWLPALWGTLERRYGPGGTFDRAELTCFGNVFVLFDQGGGFFPCVTDHSRELQETWVDTVVVEGTGRAQRTNLPDPSSRVRCGFPFPFPCFTYEGTQTVTVTPVERRLEVAIRADPGELPPVLNPRCGSGASSFTVTVDAGWSDGSSPAGLSVALRSEFVAGTGGHAHQTEDREGFGTFVPSGGQIGSSGQFTTQYRPGEIGGIERLTAVVSDGAGTSASAATEVRIRVPGLIELVSGRNVEVGGGLPEHPSNAFGTGFAIGKMIALADTFFEATREGEGAGIRIPFNDMSLEFGGIFDRNKLFIATEDPGHVGHRCGQEVDVVDKIGDRSQVLEAYLRELVRSRLLNGEFLRHQRSVNTIPSYHLRFTR